MSEAEVNILKIPRDKLTPGMRQYQDAKRENPDCIIFLRMGDFYELFYGDAVTASKELEITLTSRGKGERRAPLAGIPYHALEPYLGRLVKKGYKVAIVEQLEDPKQAKGLVKRGLVRIVTPGTVIDASMLTETENNYVMSLTIHRDQYAAAFCDLSTGEFFTTSFKSEQSLINDIVRLNPAECIVPMSLMVNQELIAIIKDKGCYINSLDDYHFKHDNARKSLLTHFNLSSLDSFGLEGHKLNIAATGGLLQYLFNTQKNSLTHLKKVSLRTNQENMIVGQTTFRNLELTKSIRDGSSKFTLFWVLDQSVTSMGSRLLKRWITSPLLNRDAINTRLDAVEELRTKIIPREDISDSLKEIYDLERLISRVNYGNASPRDLLALGNSLKQIPLLKEKLGSFRSGLLLSIAQMSGLEEVDDFISKSIREDTPITIREGGVIKSSFNEELANLHDIKANGTKYLQEIEKREIEKTGIPLKIKYNRVFGYFLEVTKRHVKSVPDTYIRKQTTVNAERYITQELKVEEEKILGANEKIKELEYRLFQEVIRFIASRTDEIQTCAQKIAVLDCVSSLSKVAFENNYTRPEFVEEKILQIRGARHPVLEKIETRYITNDVMMNENEMMIITGPNMAGKSSCMRQSALIVLMAQMGSFVPANECVLGIVDRIFTRVGAHDDLSSGQSTFMVEMNETASILHNATENSLIILDEIGRGTSTFDGVSIAWSVAEHIYNHIKAKTMFATHYHIMNKLADKFERIKNFNIAVKERGGEVIFLRKLVEGGTDQSYGVHVAKLAGLPTQVLKRAREIQRNLQDDDEMMHKIQVKKIHMQKSLGDW